jgi:HlyD family secretion protein
MKERHLMTFRRIALLLLGAAIVLLLILAFLPGPVLVDTEQVTRGYLSQTIVEEGRTRIRDRFVVSAPIAGQTRRLELEVGDIVREGATLVILDPLASPVLDPRTLAQARARVSAAEAVLSTAQEEHAAAAATARFAADELERLRTIAQEQLIAPSQVEQAEAEALRTAALERSAHFRVRTARAELEAARAALAFTGEQEREMTEQIVLRAPVTGQVLERFFQSARAVQPGEPIMVVGDPAALEVEVDVLSSDAVRLEPGMMVLLERWGFPAPLEARVRRIEPRGFTKFSALGVEEQRVLVIVDITSPRQLWERLGDAYRVIARFILWEADDVIRVHTSALFRHGPGWAVFVAEEGRARLRQVETGRRGELMTEVLSGLQPGEAVIVHPDAELEDGRRIRVP